MHRWPLRPLAFCSVKETVLFLAFILVVVELAFGVLFAVVGGLLVFLLSSTIVFGTFGVLFVFFVFLYLSKTFVISRDCLSCRLGFHVEAHEMAHITNDSSDELMVEQQTLALTRDKLMPLLNEEPKLCSYCIFNDRFYKKEAEAYCRQAQNLL